MIASISHLYFYGGENWKGDGISEDGYKSLKQIFTEAYPNSTASEIKDSSEFEPKKWSIHSIAILPGGRCREWKWLNDHNKVADFKAFVQKGGRVFAVCAGAYACAKQSEFIVEDHSVIKGERGIDFFQGKVTGPLLVDNNPVPNTRLNAQAIKIAWESSEYKNGYVVINGGGYFEKAKELNYKVLASYLDQPEEKSQAVVECQVGEGLAILSFVHFEYQGKHYPLEPLKQLKPTSASLWQSIHKKIQDGESFQKECLDSIIKRFNKIDNPV